MHERQGATTRRMIYFVQHPADRYVKIGQTSDLHARLPRLCKEYGAELVVLGVMEGGRQEEKALHEEFAKLRRFGEWYTPGEKLLTFIQIHTTPLTEMESPSSSPRNDALLQAERKVREVQELYYARYPDGLGDGELAWLLRTTRMTACRYRLLLGGEKIAPGKYRVVPSPRDIQYAMTTLKAAMRSEQISERHVAKALFEHGA
jgi:hypothetical protein